MSRRMSVGSLLTLTVVSFTFTALSIRADSRKRSAPSSRAADASDSDPEGRDSILDWNAFALQAVVDDHSGTYGKSQQAGPTRTSRALAIVHAAMFDAANSVIPDCRQHMCMKRASGASLDAAVAAAAKETLSALYSNQADVFQTAFDDYVAAIDDETARTKGIEVGRFVARRILKARKNDGSDVAGSYTPTGLPGNHDVDPLNPDQGFLTPAWGQVKPFALGRRFHDNAPPPPELRSSEYAAAFNDVKMLGGDGTVTPTIRTDEQTEIGLYWAYDGAKGIGTPPRLYNQIARVISLQEGTTEIENARLFALINIAMADAAIVCWGVKYNHAFWRPILGIRHADEDGNNDTTADPEWTPLGAPASNKSGKNFTPPFPAYPSGHATFGGAVFRILARFYGTDEIEFTFVSDELNGTTTDSAGNVRPLKPRSFSRLSDASIENARSRIYLGVHWQFDADEGMRSGISMADAIFDRALRPCK